MDFDETVQHFIESASSESNFSREEDEYEVEYIIGKRIRYGGVRNSILCPCNFDWHTRSFIVGLNLFLLH